MRIITALMVCTSLMAMSAQAKPKFQVKKQVEARKTTEMVVKVNDYWQSHHKTECRGFWDNAAYYTGNMAAYELTKKPEYLQYAKGWAEYNKWTGATEQDPQKWEYKTYGEDMRHVLFADWQICFQVYIDLYNLEGGEDKIARAKEVMNYQASMPDVDFWWWSDALYMGMPIFTKLYKVTGDEKLLDKQYESYRWTDELLFDKEDQLYYRDGKYIWPKVTTACNGGKSFWARGDGWVLAGLAKVLRDMPSDYKHRQFFVDKYVRLAKAVAGLQQKEGYWTRSMMDPLQAPGPETSGTAFFTYGILWGVNNGYLAKKEFAPVIRKAWKYLTKTALQPDGKVGYVQPIGEKAIPGQVVDQNSQANFGVGAFLLAACEYVRYVK